jgi:hypothetical protein
VAKEIDSSEATNIVKRIPDLVRGVFTDKKVVIFPIFILSKRVLSYPNTLCLYIFIDSNIPRPPNPRHYIDEISYA